MIPNRMLLGTTLCVVLLATTASAQISRTRIYSRPEAPSAEALRRLNLRMAWRAYVPMDGRRDGLLRVELDRKDLIVLTRSGEVLLLNPETGKERWRAQVGKPYTLLPFYAANSRAVYVFANAQLIALDRATGGKKWDHQLPAGLSGGPIADEEMIYLPSANGRLYAFYLPRVNLDKEVARGRPVSALYGSGKEIRDIRPTPVWEEETNIQLLFQPVQTDDTLFVISPSGEGIGFMKVKREGAGSTVIYRFSTEGKIRAPLGSYGDTVYIGSDDAALYAVNLLNGKLRWRHSAGTAIRRRPIALEHDVYITSDREGMARIDSSTGDSLWKIPRGRAILDSNPEAEQFLAANNRFVYAADFSNRLVVLDRKRGVRLSMLDTRAFHFPVINEITDRVYLASNHGLIVCLHDRDQMKPLRHRLELEKSYSPLLKIVEEKVNEPGSKPMTLREVLTYFRTKYKLHFVPNEMAFKEAGNADVMERMVTIARLENLPLKTLLERVLSQANATYLIDEDTLVLIPAKPAKPAKPEK